MTLFQLVRRVQDGLLVLVYAGTQTTYALSKDGVTIVLTENEMRNLVNQNRELINKDGAEPQIPRWKQGLFNVKDEI